MRSFWALSAVGLALAGPAMAQTTPATTPQDADRQPVLDDVVVIGSRGAPRVVTDSAAPVDVLSGEQLAARGFNDLSKVLEFLSPSFNYPRSSSGPSIAGARPAMLRGLSPDQVLVLINGHRRHASSLIQFNNGAQRGAVPIDYSTIPVSAIERVEILRDGAAAQYGSDAIAGVINVVLREDAHGGMASVQYGQTERGDGETGIVAGRAGFALGEGGFLTVSGEIRDRAATNAAEIDPRVGRVSSMFGDPESTDINLVVNAGLPLSETAELYGFLTASRRDAESSPLFRLPSVAPTLYPQGFLPIIGLGLDDVGANLGARGQLGGWRWDLSNTFGYSSGDYDVWNTVNTSLGAASPTRFYGGGARYRQNIVNLTLDRSYAVLAGTHLAGGLEHRIENYEIVSGEPSSFALSGAQGFPGFNPPTPVDVDRNAQSAFLDGELSLIDGLDLGVAVRYENYSDFGDQVTGKASVFWRPIDGVALRGTASTGLRAPSLQQQYFSTVTSQLNGGLLTNVGTFAVSDRVAQALGSSPLRAETSTNYSFGLVLTPFRGLSFAIDAYQIQIEDRIALSENLQGPQVAAILLANGVTNAAVARFFTNAADTTSEGFEATMHWRTALSDTANLALTLGYGAFDTDIDRIAANPVLPASPLLGSASIELMADGQPRNKALANIELTLPRWRLAADITRFGSHVFPAPAGGTVRVDGSTSLDLSAAYDVTDRITVLAGVLNATDAYPARLPNEMTGRPYSEADPLGVNGREFFLRLAFTY